MARHRRGSHDVGEAVDVCAEPHERSHAAGLRVRVPRRQLRDAQHPERSEGGRSSEVVQAFRPASRRPGDGGPEGPHYLTILMRPSIAGATSPLAAIYFSSAVATRSPDSASTSTFWP